MFDCIVSKTQTPGCFSRPTLEVLCLCVSLSLSVTHCVASSLNTASSIPVHFHLRPATRHQFTAALDLSCAPPARCLRRCIHASRLLFFQLLFCTPLKLSLTSMMNTSLSVNKDWFLLLFIFLPAHVESHTGATSLKSHQHGSISPTLWSSASLPDWQHNGEGWVSEKLKGIKRKRLN